MNDCKNCKHSKEPATFETCRFCRMARNWQPIPTISDNQDDLIKLWNDAGGSFHGPITETATIPADKLFELLRKVMS